MNIIFKKKIRTLQGICSIKKVLLKISPYSQEKAVLESLFNNVAGIQACDFVKKKLQNRRFPVNIAKFLRTLILKNF